MSRRLPAAVAAFAALALTAGVVPAFTADNGTVTVTVTAQAPAAPCLTVTPDTVDFGTLPFTRPDLISSGDSTLTAANCGTADQHLLASATEARGPGSSWLLTRPTGSGNTCEDLTDVFYLRIASTNGSFDVLFLSGTPTPVPASLSGPPAVFPASSSRATQLRLYMPCEGSSGGAKTITATFTAVVA